MAQFLIERDRGEDIAFEGEELAQISDRWVGGKEQSRWTKYALYKTESDRYVLYEAFKMGREGQVVNKRASVFRSAEEVADWVIGDDDIVSNLKKRLFENAAHRDDAFRGLVGG